MNFMNILNFSQAIFGLSIVNVRLMLQEKSTLTLSSSRYKREGSKLTTGSKTDGLDDEVSSVECFTRSRAWVLRERRRL